MTMSGSRTVDNGDGPTFLRTETKCRTVAAVGASSFTCAYLPPPEVQPDGTTHYHSSGGPTFHAHKKCRTVAAVMMGELALSTTATVLHFRGA